MGRKKKMWLDVFQDTQATYKPNTIGAIGRVGIEDLPSDDTPFIRVVERLANLQADSPARSHIEFVTQVRLRYVVCRFLCLKMNIRPLWPLVDHMGKPLKARALKCIDVLAAEATALFNLASDAYGLDVKVPGFGSAAEVWGALMLEGPSGVATSEWIQSVELGTPLTKKAAIRQYRSHTAALSDRENPYTHGIHQKFFDTVMPLALAGTGRAPDRHPLLQAILERQSGCGESRFAGQVSN